MRLYHSTYTDAQGATHEAASLTFEFRDHLDTVRRLTLFEDQRASEAAAGTIQRLVRFRRARAPLDGELTAWVEGSEPRLVARLVEWGILDAARLQAARPLAQHLEEWRGALAAKGNTAKHVQVHVARVKTVLDRAGVAYVSDVTPERLRVALVALREENGWSAATANHHLTAVKGFFRWLTVEERAARNPALSVHPLPRKTVQAESRKRRAVSADEARRLLRAAEEGPERRGMNGPERALLYRLALETGLRLSELANLRAGSFTFGARPAVHLEAHLTKGGRRADLPLREATALALQEHLRDRLPGARAFALSRHCPAAVMLRADAKAAGLDLAGLDFHSLRHSFITALAASGVHPSVAQSLARHSTISLTMDRYTHVAVERQSEAVALLPDLDAPAAEAEIREATTGGVVRAGTAFVTVENAKENAKEEAAGAQACREQALAGRRQWISNPQVAGPSPAGDAFGGVVASGRRGGSHCEIPGPLS